jgi:PQQ-dependent catabolism-associated CXXCW motif protein
MSRWPTVWAAALLLSGAPALTARAGVPEPSGFRLDGFDAPVPATLRGATVIGTKATIALHDAGKARFIDVLSSPRRPPAMQAATPWLPPAHRDIPGSIWLPDAGREPLSPAMHRWFLAALARASGRDFNHPLVFYCHAQCWMSWNAAKQAIADGYRQVFWYPAGLTGWQAAGLPLATTEPEAQP